MNSKRLRICVIVACYNSSKFLAEALASIQKQTRSPDEVLVVDDCSTDNSREIARNYSIRLLSTERNSGPAAARNLGLKACSSDVVAWLDADDFWERRHLEVVVGLLEKHPQAALAYSGIEAFGRRKFKWKSFPCENSPAYVVENCFRSNIVPAMAVATRTQELKSIGGFNENMRAASDFDGWLRLSLDHLFVCTSNITAHYRNHSEQISCNPNQQLRLAYQSRLSFLDMLLARNDLKLHSQLQYELSKILESDLKKFILLKNVEMQRFVIDILNNRTELQKSWLTKTLLKLIK